jgi:sugar-specific transcriptional regulator TrmB
MNLFEVLKNYGFSEKESNVYLACLQLNIAPASTIARFCNEKRLAVYDILKFMLDSI